MAVELMITQAGLDALVDAQDGTTTAIMVTQVGITASAFTMAPTITALPGEIKRISAVSGLVVSPTIIHMTAQDAAADTYNVRGLGLYLADGTLFALYSQTTPIFTKVSAATFLLALDIAFSGTVSGEIIFGDTSFLLPPASETVKGVAEIATQAEANAGIDDTRIVSPKKVKVLLDALAAALGTNIDGLSAALSALLARTISGGGLVAGGGNLTASRTLTVTAASAGDVAAASANDRAVTPLALAGLVNGLAALIARTITGTGLVTGGGDHSANRTLNVDAADVAETIAGILTSKAVTPAAFAGALASVSAWNPAIPLFRIPGTPVIIQAGKYRGLAMYETAASLVFPQTFPTACIWVGPIGYINADSNYRDLWVQMREHSASGFEIFYQADDGDDNRSDGFDWLAVGY